MRARFVNEHVNFERKKDHLSSLGVGQKQLITTWLNQMEVENYTINDDYTIDVKSNVNISNRSLDRLPSFIKFGSVDGGFYCHNNQLTSLEGCPSSVGGSFDCNNNQLTSLEGCPSSVGGYFYCGYNQLTSLEGCPGSVGGGFYCYNNKVKFTKEDVKKLCKVDKNKIYC
jgi:hypothetical protein